jgi:DNA-binding winged helix-turn-helix (wHTH) protein/TolB-like protein/Flp pilus assembly protein TadD
MTEAAVKAYKIKGFKIDVSRRLLLDESGETVALTPKVFDLLLFLVGRPGKRLTKDEIMSAVWPDTIVEESNLTQNISILRRALGDTRGGNLYVATIPGQGYCFVAEVETLEADMDAPGELAALSKPAVDTRRRKVPLWIFGLTAVVVAVAAFYLYSVADRNTEHGRTRVLAILPFRPLVDETSDEALEFGMTDTLISRLSNLSGLVLRPLSSVRKFRGAARDPQAAGRELGADAVLDGSIQRWGEQIRVNVRLVDVASGEGLWGGTFDEKYNDIFVVQDAISSRVAQELRIKLGRSESSRLSARPTGNVEAYRLYLQARLYQFKATPQEVRRAIEFYRDAIALDPTYTLAYAGMADAYRMLPITSDVASQEAFPESKAAALKAIELDPQLAEGHLAFGYVASWYEWDWKTAETEMRKAIELSPNNSEAHRGLSILLTLLARHDEAISEMKLARELDPLSLPNGALEAQTLFYAGRDAEAVDRLNKTFEIDPNFWIARLMLARILIGQNRWNEALAELQRARTASGGNTETVSMIGFALARSGRRDEALKSLDELRNVSLGAYVPAYNIAMLQNGLGDKDAALTSLEDAAERKDVRLILLKVEHKWDNLRSEPRFSALMRRIGFP